MSRIEESTLTMDAVQKRKAGENLFNEAVARQYPNRWARPRISAQVRLKYLKRLGVIALDHAGRKTKARQAAFLNIRNPLSLVCMMRVICRSVDPALVFSSDDVSILLNGWAEKPSILTTKHARELLRKINIEVSVAENTGKQRVVTFNATISYQRCICKVIKWSDYNFTEFREKPKVLDMGDCFFIILHHPQTDPVLVQKM